MPRPGLQGNGLRVPALRYPMPMTPNSLVGALNARLAARDLAHVWHPCTQMKDHERDMPMIPIRRGDGVWLEDFDGHRYLDAISSWWVNLFGHANPVLNGALREQLDQLEHVIFAGFTHEPAIELADKEQLVAIERNRRMTMPVAVVNRRQFENLHVVARLFLDLTNGALFQ